MKKFLRVSKIFSILNLVLLCILGYLALNLIAGKTRQVHAIDPKTEAAQADINTDNILSNTVNPKIILERNIFSPVTVSASQKSSQKETVETQSAKPVTTGQLELRLLGTVAGDENAACAIIEDTKTRIQELYKTGDLVQGARIEKIERNRIMLLNEGIQQILNLYVGSEDNMNAVASTKETKSAAPEKNSMAGVIKVTSPTEREVNKSAFLAKVGGVEAVMKTVDITPHLVNGKADGLKITGLEGLSMARFVGLENGDVIQVINGQFVTDSRKAFQVLRKARALSSLDMQLLRGSERKTLSFKIQ